MEKILISCFVFLLALKLTGEWDMSLWVMFSPLAGCLFDTYEIVKIKKDEDEEKDSDK